MTSKTCT